MPTRHTTLAARLFTMALATAVLLAGSAATALAGKSHLGQKPTQHVTLVWTFLTGVNDCFTADRGFAELGADGTVLDAKFEIPTGYALVVTDVQWTSSGSPSAGHWPMFSLSFNQSPFQRPFFRSATHETLNATGYWSGSAILESGFRVAAGSTICPGTSMTNGSGTYLINTHDTVLRGYLIKSK